MKGVRVLSGYGLLGTGVWSVVVAFLGVSPVAGVVGLCYRFPIPFYKVVSGMEGLMQAPLGVLFFVLIGGWVAFLMLPFLLGAALFSARTPDVPGAKDDGWSALIAGLGVDLVFCLVLATLDFFIGPW